MRPRLISVISPIKRSKNINFNSVFLFFFDLFGEISFERSPNKIDGKKLLIILAREFNKKYVWKENRIFFFIVTHNAIFPSF